MYPFDKKYKYPHTSFNEINLDWLVKKIRDTVNSIFPDILPIDRGGTGATTAEQARINLGIADPPTIDYPIAVNKGGTGATTAAQAKINLGISDGQSVEYPITIDKGGTGATTAAAARTELGLGNMAVENTPLALAKGGTGATTAAAARNNLGVGFEVGGITVPGTAEHSISSGSYVVKFGNFILFWFAATNLTLTNSYTTILYLPWSIPSQVIIPAQLGFTSAQINILADGTVRARINVGTTETGTLRANGILSTVTSQ